MPFNISSLKIPKAGEPITDDWVNAISAIAQAVGNPDSRGITFGSEGLGIHSPKKNTSILARITGSAISADAPAHHNQDTENGADGSWWRWEEVQIANAPTLPGKQSDRYPLHYRTLPRKYDIDGCALSLSGTAHIGDVVLLNQHVMDNGTIVWIFQPSSNGFDMEIVSSAVGANANKYIYTGKLVVPNSVGWQVVMPQINFSDVENGWEKPNTAAIAYSAYGQAIADVPPNFSHKPVQNGVVVRAYSHTESDTGNQTIRFYAPTGFAGDCA